VQGRPLPERAPLPAALRSISPRDGWRAVRPAAPPLAALIVGAQPLARPPRAEEAVDGGKQVVVGSDARRLGGAHCGLDATLLDYVSEVDHAHERIERLERGQAQPYRPLTSENAALVLVDHQVGLLTGVRDYSTGELKHNVVALALG
jgi:hypothetical protein